MPIILIALVAGASFQVAYVRLASDPESRASCMSGYGRELLWRLFPEHSVIIFLSAAMAAMLLVLAILMSATAFRMSYDVEALIAWIAGFEMYGSLDTGALLRVALLYPLAQCVFFGFSRDVCPGDLAELLLACGAVGFVGLLVSQFGTDFLREGRDAKSGLE